MRRRGSGGVAVLRGAAAVDGRVPGRARDHHLCDDRQHARGSKRCSCCARFKVVPPLWSDTHRGRRVSGFEATTSRGVSDDGPCGVQFVAARLQLLNVRLDGRVIVDSAMTTVRQRGSCGAVVHRNTAPVLSNDESQRVRRGGSCGAACHRNATAVVGRTSERARDRRLCNDDRRVCGSVGLAATLWVQWRSGSSGRVFSGARMCGRVSVARVN